MHANFKLGRDIPVKDYTFYSVAFEKSNSFPFAERCTKYIGWTAKTVTGGNEIIENKWNCRFKDFIAWGSMTSHFKSSVRQKPFSILSIMILIVLASALPYLINMPYNFFPSSFAMLFTCIKFLYHLVSSHLA